MSDGSRIELSEAAGAAVNRVGGYVLAGGRSSRMGRDKALLELAGRPLVAHAVAKLKRVTGEANILAGQAPGNPALAGFGPLVFDHHLDCGPIGGISAALAHSPYPWVLILPVDVPFLPERLLSWWVRRVTAAPNHAPVALFEVEGVAQPTVLLVRREVGPVLGAAIAQGEYKLLPALRRAARALAPESERYILRIEGTSGAAGLDSPQNQELWSALPAAQRAAQRLWFANLNTPEEFAAAATHAAALDDVGPDD